MSKIQMLVGLLVSQMLGASIALAEEIPSANAEIPIIERDFVNTIHGFDKEKIIAQFGEPSKADDVKIKGSGKIVASIWQYHHINKAADGTFYETTELDFIDNKVVSVVFLNNNGEEVQDGKTYEVPLEFPKPNAQM